jgi:hypothetical protein
LHGFKLQIKHTQLVIWWRLAVAVVVALVLLQVVAVVVAVVDF